MGTARSQDAARGGEPLSATVPGKRVALVIGNFGYRHVATLPNPVNDATDMAAALGRLDFDVTLANDLDYTGMRAALRSFGRAARQAEIALFYFAGHGIEIDRSNYLLPVDAQLVSDTDVEYEAISLDLVMTAISSSRGVRLVILDACRNNPFAARMRMSGATRSIGRGLAAVEPATGTLVGYAAREGTTANDGGARNSPYTIALLANLEIPGLEIQLMFRRVRDHVLEATGGTQEPFTYGSLPGREIYIKAPAQSAAASGDPELGRDVALWNAVKNSGHRPALESYLERFPSGTFAGLARTRIAALGDAAASQEPDGTLVARLQRELARVGCDPGSADGVWGGKTRRAAERFAKLSGVALPTHEPQAAMLDALGRATARVCPPPRQTVKAAQRPAAKSTVRTTQPAVKRTVSSEQPAAGQKTCRTETRDECRIRARAAGAKRRSGFCRNLKQICS
jgi:hypothetical protein